MATSRDLDQLAQERATNEGMPEAKGGRDAAHNRARWDLEGESMDKQKALDTIDAAIKALTELEHAIKRNNPRVVDMEIQILWLELGNLREIVEKLDDKDN